MNGEYLFECSTTAPVPRTCGEPPPLRIKKCPQCGDEVEIFSNDVSVKCSSCGFEIYNDIESCVQWCRHAKECVGEEMYNKLMERAKKEPPE